MIIIYMFLKFNLKCSHQRVKNKFTLYLTRIATVLSMTVLKFIIIMWDICIGQKGTSPKSTTKSYAFILVCSL